MNEHASLHCYGLLADLNASRVLKRWKCRSSIALRLRKLHKLRPLARFRVVDETLPAELCSFEGVSHHRVSYQLLSLLVHDMEQLKSDVLTVDPPPDEVNDELKGLWEQLCSDNAQVPKKSSVTLSVVLVNVDTGQTMGHFLAIVESNNLHVVTFVTSLHQLVKLFGLIRRTSKLRHQLLVIVLSKVQELSRRYLERL